MGDLEDILESMGLELTEKELLQLLRKLQADGKCLKQTQLFQQGQVFFSLVNTSNIQETVFQCCNWQGQVGGNTGNQWMKPQITDNHRVIENFSE